jgi:hypothetical protein
MLQSGSQLQIGRFLPGPIETPIAIRLHRSSHIGRTFPEMLRVFFNECWRFRF